MTRDGDLEPIDDGWQLRFTRHLPHDADTVWRAITEPEHLAAWFPTTIDGDRAPGAALRFRFEHGEGDPFDGEMLVWDPPNALEFTWGTDVIRMEIAPAASGCTLVLLDRIDQHGKAARDAAGWHVCLDALERALGGAPSNEARGALEGWNDVAPRYRERFGPAASTIGPPEAHPAGS
jgi:uncharacterized protein YndB with AHSA1/START domain